MERPEHSLRGQISGSAAQLAPRRFGGLVLVTAIHVAIVAVLILGLVAGEVEKKKDDLQATVEQQKVEAKAPPPPGDGCDQLQWWFDQLNAPPHPHGPPKAPPRLPEACYPILGLRG